MRIGAALLLLVVLVLSVPRLFDPATWVLFEAVRELGPISGWRCAHAATYVYDPAYERWDSTLLDEAPETTVLDDAPEVEVDHVEANLRGGETSVWTHDGNTRRVYVLSPGRLQAITIDQTGRRDTICDAHLGDWQIVGEQQLD